MENYMLKKFLAAGLLFYALAVTPLGAANVSFLILETGLPAESPVNRYSILWENSLMEIFFETGHIVSNAPMLRLNEKPAGNFPHEAERDFDDAKDGGMDYFFIALIDHKLPRNVSMRLFSIETQQMIQQQIFTDTVSSTAKEEQEKIKKAIGTFVSGLW